jgi:hypothetical protein
MFLSRYQDRPSTLKVERGIVDNGRKGTIHSLNEFDITVWEDGEVTARRKYYAKSDPQSTFPNMTVDGGSINLPIDDLVEFILARISPAELAEGLMDDDEARAALVYKMSERYSSPTFIDGDRRELLTKVQQQVYAEAIGHAIERLEKSETAHRCRDDYYRWRKVEIGHYRSIYEYVVTLLGSVLKDDPSSEKRLEAFRAAHMAPAKLDEFISDGRDPVVKESVGPHWYEIRDYWRKRLEEFFPEPALEAAEAL